MNPVPVFLAVLCACASCGTIKKPSLSVETYASFRAECLLVQEAYPQNTPERKKLLKSIMVKFAVDSARLENFYTYYKKKPETWYNVENAVEIKLRDMQKRSVPHGGR